MISSFEIQSGSRNGQVNASVMRSTNYTKVVGAEMTTSSRTSHTRLMTAPIAVATTPSTQPITATLRPPAVPGVSSMREIADRPMK